MTRLRVPKVDGRFPAKHYRGIDPALAGLKAFSHPTVREWHRWLLEEYEPRYSIALVTPCSNVKPYTRSPTSRKIAGLLRRLGLWGGSEPHGIEWLYLSDLLVLVPYQRAEEYPACCYELHPEELLRSPRHYNIVVEILARVVEMLAGRMDAVVVYLPRRHLAIWEDARRSARSWPREVRVKYTIFGVKELEEALRRIAADAGNEYTLDKWFAGHNRG